MPANEKRYRRLALLHEKLKRLEQGRLARLETRARDLSDDEKKLIEYFNSDSFSQIFPDLVMGRIRSNRADQAETASAIEQQAAATQAQARRLRQAELMLDKSVERREREAAEASLREILERVAQTPKVSAR